MIFANEFIFFINLSKEEKSMGCKGSTAEFSGSECTSSIMASAPAATAARLIGSTQFLQNVAWEGSTAIGKCVISLAAGTTCKSKRNLEVSLCVWGTDTPLSHKITFKLPS